MPNKETVRALINAFNANNYFSNTVGTNFTLQSRDGEDCIVVLFDKGMNRYQCRRYLDSIKRKVVGEFYGIGEGDKDEVVLNTAIFNIESFPFNISKGKWSQDEQGRIEFLAPIDKGVIFNLKSHLASSLKKDVIEDMPICHMVTEAFDKKKYLCHSKFPNKKLCKEFEREFLSRMKERYENVPKNPLKVEGNSVYIKDVFNDAHFVDSVTRYKAWLTGMDLGVGNDVDHRVKSFKNMIIRSAYSATEVMVDGFILAPPLNGRVVSILTPIMQNGKEFKLLTKEEAHAINHAFNNAVLDDVSDKVQAEISVNGDRIKYGINFSDREISHCVITKIIENSVINKDHELSIDPELRFRALSRSPSTELSDMEWESPTRSQDGALKESPRQGSMVPVLQVNSSDIPGTSGGFRPSTRMSSTAVNRVIEPEKCVGAAANMPAGASTSNRWLSQCTSGNQWMSSPQPTQPRPSDLSWTQSGPSSWPSPPPAHENKWMPSLPFTKQGPSDLSWTQSSSGPLSSLPPPPPLIPISGSVSGSRLPVSFTSTQDHGSSPPPLIRSSGGIVPRFRPTVGRSSSSRGASERRISDKPLTEEGKKLIEELLYMFNLNNYILECPNTNFIVENGKIASSISDGVNVKEYLQELRGYTIKEYCGTEEEAKEAYDLNEFPFKFLSNCEKNQETTVVANISCGALFNLKKLFIQESEKEVEIEDIDINIVKKAAKSKKKKWGDSQVQRGVAPGPAFKTCYPDESALKHIPIIKDKGGYYLDRTYGSWEIKSFLEELWCPKGTRNATTTFKKIEESEKDDSSSGYSSGFVTDAESVSSKAEATTSGDESMDCENTERNPLNRKSSSSEGSSSESSRSDSSSKSDGKNTGKRLPKRKFQSPGGSPEKPLRRDSSPLSRLESLSLSSSSHQIGKC